MITGAVELHSGTTRGGVIAGAMIINMAVAALAGFGVPLLLKRMRIDPALAVRRSFNHNHRCYWLHVLSRLGCDLSALDPLVIQRQPDEQLTKEKNNRTSVKETPEQL